MRWRTLSWALALVALILVGMPWIAEANDPFLVVPSADVVEASPAYRYANMSAREAIAEMDRRKILYQRVEPHGDVRTPIRLTGKLHGVHIHSALPEQDRPTTPFEICDARLVLALDDFAAQLARRDIVEVVHFTMYRPAVARASVGAGVEKLAPMGALGIQAKKTTSPAKKTTRPSTRGKTPKTTKPTTKAAEKAAEKAADKAAKKKEASTRSNSTQSRHPLGLAIDPGVFIKRDGTVLSVASHFKGKIGAATCGSRASVPKDPRAEQLWGIVCDAFDAKIFTYVLTPNFDQPHQDHFHMEINPGVRWFLYH